MTRRRSIIVTIRLTGFLLICAAWAGLPAGAQTPELAGFGVVVSANGHILTPYSTIEGCPAVSSPTLGPLRVLHEHADIDLALLQAQGGGTAYAALGDARAIEPRAPLIVAAFAEGAAQAPQLAQVQGRLFMVSSSLRNALYMRILTPDQREKNAVLVLDHFGGIVALIVRNLDPDVMMYNDFVLWAPVPGDGEVTGKAVGEVMLRRFLDHQDVTYAGAPADRRLSAQDAIEQLREATTWIECLR